MNPTGWKVTAAPTVEPVTLADVKAHVVQSLDDDDALLTSLIAPARGRWEQRTGVLLVEQTIELALPGFASVIKLPVVPVRSIESIKYYDSANSLQTLASSAYLHADHALKSRVVPAVNETWPTTVQRPDAVKVEFKAGIYQTTGASPDALDSATAAPALLNQYQMARIAILTLIGHWYNNRESTAPVNLNSVPATFEDLVAECRVDIL